jgi:hypothetical protein
MEFLIASYPRSGNEFLRAMLRNRYGVVSTPPPSAGPALQTLPGTTLFQPYYRDPTAVVGIEGRKTHEPPRPGDARPAVYLVRDGRDSIVSYAHRALVFVHHCSPAEITTERLRATIRDLILQRESAYKTWSENVELWFARPNTQVVRFETLVADPARVVDQIVDRLGLRLPAVSDAVPTFGDLNSARPLHFRSGKGGEWRELFTPELHDLFWKHNGETMARFGYGPSSQDKAA